MPRPDLKTPLCDLLDIEYPVMLAGMGAGRGLAAALALGAKGVWDGTAFLATNEANVTSENKQRFIDITEEDTRVTRLFSGKRCATRSPLVEDWGRPASRRCRWASRASSRTTCNARPNAPAAAS